MDDLCLLFTFGYWIMLWFVLSSWSSVKQIPMRQTSTATPLSIMLASGPMIWWLRLVWSALCWEKWEILECFKNISVGRGEINGCFPCNYNKWGQELWKALLGRKPITGPELCNYNRPLIFKSPDGTLTVKCGIITKRFTQNLFFILFWMFKFPFPQPIYW